MADGALQRRLMGQSDSRGPVGMLSRGKNVYNGASNAAHQGGGIQFGRPRTQEIQTGNVQPNLRVNIPSQDPMDLNPKPVNLMAAVQRKLLGGQGGY